jgi:benzoyl-CoA reductase subunit D
MIKTAGIQRKEIERIVTTGNWGESIPFADWYIPDMSAEVNGVNKICPQARTIIAVGAEGIRIIKIDSNGMVIDFAINEKCAAGNGTFVDVMARALEITTPERPKYPCIQLDICLITNVRYSANRKLSHLFIKVQNRI